MFSLSLPLPRLPHTPPPPPLPLHQASSFSSFTYDEVLSLCPTWERFLRHASLDTLNLAVRLGLLAPLFAAMHTAPPVVTALIMGRPDAFVARLITASRDGPPRGAVKPGSYLGRPAEKWWGEAVHSLAVPSTAIFREEEPHDFTGSAARPKSESVTGALAFDLALAGRRAQTLRAIVSVRPECATRGRPGGESPLSVRPGPLGGEARARAMPAGCLLGGLLE